jgi:H+/Cl- antiporter ClcA
MLQSQFSSIARRKRESIFQLNPDRPAKANFIITDLFSNIDQISKEAFAPDQQKSSLKLFLTSHHVLNPTVILALILLGLAISLLSFLMDLSIQTLQNLKYMSIEFDNTVLDLGMWVLLSIVFCELGCYFCSYLNKDSSGSGIPEMKAVLSGVKLKNFMSIRTLVSKYAGVILGIGGGLVIGKEGPIVHISGIIAHQISKIPVFSHLNTV